MTLLSQLDLHDDHFSLAGYNFRFQHQAAESSADDAFLFYKHVEQIKQFDEFFGETGFRPKTVLELGIWDGGSAAFWLETLGLQQYSAVDLQTRGDSEYLRRWLAERSAGRVSTHWGVKQTDGPALRRIVNDLSAPLDLVLDDCSHHYGPTLESFELLFPLVRPHGWYVIEDWAWALQPEFQDARHPWGLFPPLHPISEKLLGLCGSRPDVVPSVRVFPEFIAVQRGVADLSGTRPSSLIARRRRPWARVAYARTRAVVGRARRAFSA